MSKVYRVLVLLILLFNLTFISSCSSRKFVKKMNDLNNTSYTINCEMITKVITTYEEKTEENETVINYTMKCEPNETSYVVGENNNNELYSKIEDDYIKSYVKTRNGWQLQDISKVDESSDINFLFSYDIYKYFKKYNNIFFGDCDKINEVCDSFLSNLAGDYQEISGIEIKESKFSKYNIIFIDNEIKFIDMEIYISFVYEEILIETTISQFIELSEIGSTEVVTPAKLPLE